MFIFLRVYLVSQNLIELNRSSYHIWFYFSTALWLSGLFYRWACFLDVCFFSSKCFSSYSINKRFASSTGLLSSFVSLDKLVFYSFFQINWFLVLFCFTRSTGFLLLFPDQLVSSFVLPDQPVFYFFFQINWFLVLVFL